MAQAGNGVVAKASPPSPSEIGASGLQIAGGRVQDEFHKDLKGNRAVKTYREMRDNDPVIGALLFAIEMTLREVTWRTEPAEGTPNDAEAERWAEFVQSALDDMSTTWDQSISAILSFLPFGWSFLEIVYKIRGGDSGDSATSSRFDDGLVGWRKLPLRAQESLVRWVFDESGGVQSFIQATGEGPVVEIPMERGLLFRTSAARSNPEGRSILRNAYRPWFFKKRIEEIEGVGIERDLAGLPFAGVPPDYLSASATSAQKATLDVVKTIVRDIKRDEQEGIIFPREVDPETGQDLWELKLLTTGGRRQFDTDSIIARYDQRIAMTVLGDFILLGHESVGSKSLGVSKVELFLVAIDSWLGEIGSVMNAYAIPRLIAMNGVDPRYAPTLVHDEVKQVDIAAIADFVQKATASGALMDPNLDEWLREQIGAPPAAVEPTQV